MTVATQRGHRDSSHMGKRIFTNVSLILCLLELQELCHSQSQAGMHTATHAG